MVTFRQFVALRVINLSEGAIVGYSYCDEPAGLAPIGFWVFKRLCRTIGFPTEDKKGQQPTMELVLLGALVALGDSSIRASIRPDRVQKLRPNIAQSLQTGCFTPSAASVLRWELGSTQPSSPRNSEGE